MSKIVARNKRTGTEYIKVEQGTAGLLRVFTEKSTSGVTALPENIEILDTSRAIKPRKNTNPMVTFDEPMYEVGMQIKNKQTGEVIYRYQAEAPVEYVLILIADAVKKGEKHIEVYQLNEKLENDKQGLTSKEAEKL